MEANLRKIEEGDLSFEIDSKLIDRSDEIGKIAQSLNQVKLSLAGMIGDVRYFHRHIINIITRCNNPVPWLEFLGVSPFRRVLRGMRYRDDGSGYMWIDDTDYNLVMHPILPEQEGENRYDLTDQNGVKIIQNIMKSHRSEDSDSWTFSKKICPVPRERQQSPPASEK